MSNFDTITEEATIFGHRAV